MPPHILFVLVDDMGWHFPGYHGNADVRTPTNDALARDGVRLEGMYAYHMCSPSRSSLLTGRLPASGGKRVQSLARYDARGSGDELHLPATASGDSRLL